MTACNQKETSVSMGSGETEEDLFWFGAFTYAVTLGSGYDMLYDETCTPFADYNGNNDGQTTLGEAYADTVDTVLYVLECEQSPQYYGDDSFVLWSR